MPGPDPRPARTPDVSVHRFAERALLIRVADQSTGHALTVRLLEHLAAGRLVDVVPGDRSMLIEFDGTDVGERVARRALAQAAEADRRGGSDSPRRAPRRRVIPVRYGGTFGPDLDTVSSLAGLSATDVIGRHVGRDHPVLFLGFAPGFAYCGDLEPGLVVERLSSPRTTTPPGSVAIAEGYTGIYPASLPGGWRVIGWTPVILFDPVADPPTYLLPGDTVRFEAIEPADGPAAPYRPTDWGD